MLTKNKVLYHLGLLEITTESVANWATERDISKLILALKKGNYKIRRFAAATLGNLKATSALKALAIATKDEVKDVALIAINSLKKFLPSTKVEANLAEAELIWSARDRVELGKRNYHKARKKYFGMEVRTWDKGQMHKLRAAKAFLRSNSS